MKSFGSCSNILKKYSGVLILTVLSMLLLWWVQLLAPWIVKTMVATVTDSNMAHSDMQEITKLALSGTGSVYRTGRVAVRTQLYGTCRGLERGRRRALQTV